MIQLYEETENAERRRKAEERESERRNEVVLLFLCKRCDKCLTFHSAKSKTKFYLPSLMQRRWKVERQTDRGKQKKKEKRLEETRLNFALFIVIVSANIDI